MSRLEAWAPAGFVVLPPGKTDCHHYGPSSDQYREHGMSPCRRGRSSGLLRSRIRLGHEFRQLGVKILRGFVVVRDPREESVCCTQIEPSSRGGVTKSWARWFFRYFLKGLDIRYHHRIVACVVAFKVSLNAILMCSPPGDDHKPSHVYNTVRRFMAYPLSLNVGGFTMPVSVRRGILLVLLSVAAALFAPRSRSGPRTRPPRPSTRCRPTWRSFPQASALVRRSRSSAKAAPGRRFGPTPTCSRAGRNSNRSTGKVRTWPPSGSSSRTRRTRNCPR